jgi:PTS system cellobiose-specific IIC component
MNSSASKFNMSKMVDVMGRLAANRYMVAMRNAYAPLVPITLIGALFVILLNIPITQWTDFIAPFAAKLQIPMTFAMEVMALYICVGMSSALCEIYKLDKVSVSVMSILAFFIAAVTPTYIDPAVAEKAGIAVSGTVLPTANMGAGGIFTGIIISVFTVEIAHFCQKHKITIKMPQGVPTAVADSFAALIPGMFSILVVWGVRVGLNFDINGALRWVFSPIRAFTGDNILSVIIPILLITLFWFLGIHGMAIVTPLLSPFWTESFLANVQAAGAGKPIPHFVTGDFFVWFVWIGGAGATFALAFLMAFFGKSVFSKKLGRFTIIPGLFNINEPLMFGAPIVMNPFFIIPFIGAPLAMGVITYIANALHLISYPFATAPWMIPAPIGAFLACGLDWRALVLSLINIVVAVAIYFPFFRAFDRKMLAQELENEKQKASAQEAPVSATVMAEKI